MIYKIKISICIKQFILVLFITSLMTPDIKGQSYKKMTPEVYSQWNKLSNVKISDYANTVTYILEKEIGDKKMAAYLTGTDTTLFFSRVSQSFHDPSGKYIIYTHNISYDSLQSLKRKKTKKDKLPKDSLTIYNTITHQKTTFNNIEKVFISDNYGDYIFFTKKQELKPIETISTSVDSIQLLPDTSVAPAKVAEKRKNNKNKLDDLYIYYLTSGKTDTISAVSDFILASEAPELAYVTQSHDSIPQYSVNLYSIQGKATKTILDSVQDVTNLCFDKNGNRLSFLASTIKSKAKQPSYDLYLYVPKDTSAHIICDVRNPVVPQNWIISKDRQLSFSESGKRLFFGIAPLLPVQDTTLLESEVVNVEIWKYDTPFLYTEMNANKEKDSKKTYNVMYDLTRNTFLQLENTDEDIVLTSDKGDGKYALALRTLPYRKQITWTGDTPADMILIDTDDNTRMIISQKEYGRPLFSPSGLYMYWWNRQDSIWKVFNTETKIISVMGLWSLSTFYDEENDIPQKADPYGLAGWLPGDSIAIVYDRYDLWQLKPSDPFYSKKLTNGRSNKDVYRYIRLNPKEDYIPVNNNILLHVFNEKSKTDRIELFVSQKDSTSILTGGEYKISPRVMKAKESPQLVFTRENFEVFPDLLFTDTTFTDIKKISDANPQQKDFGWGHAESVKWTNYDGKPNEGMLFFPPDFDPDKQYPLIVNFYEKSSDDLYKYRAPEAHRSTINYTYYTNNGYIVFNPDIKYITGQPGEDCYNAVESGVDYVTSKGYVNIDRMALQGHSWGGYQIAYLLTKTDRYRCAEAGAPVVNMVSAYGGIRWESGMSRMFQYEKTQSRLGVALWEDPETYHMNSPIYDMPKVKTPILILHNDMDGAVPWYQGIEYFMALRRLNKPAWLLNYNQEPHWPVKWQNRLDFNIRLEQFFNYYLKDAPMPLWMKEGNSPLEKGILNKY